MYKYFLGCYFVTNEACADHEDLDEWQQRLTFEQAAVPSITSQNSASERQREVQSRLQIVSRFPQLNLILHIILSLFVDQFMSNS
jgi:hypothetical protein